MHASSVHELFQRATVISQKLDTELEKFDVFQQQIREEESTAHNKNNHASTMTGESVKQFLNTYRKWYSQMRSQIAKLDQNCEQLLDNNDSLENRFIILNTSYQELKSAVVDLRQSLKQGKDNITITKKLKTVLEGLENEHKSESTAVNKLQFVYNNTFALNQEMEEKIKQLQTRQQNLSAQLEWDIQKQVQNESNWRDSDRYEKLIKQKGLICQHIGQIDDEKNNKYLQTFSNIQLINKKIKDMDEVYKQLDINAAEQDLIIRQIMLREGITSDQLLEATAKQNHQLRQYQEAARLKISHAKPIQAIPQFYQLRQGKKPTKLQTEPTSNIYELSHFRAANDQSQQMRITARKKQNSLGTNYQNGKLPAKQIPNIKNVSSPQRFNPSVPLLPKIHFGSSEQVMLAPITHNQRIITTQSMPLKYKSAHFQLRNKQGDQLNKRRRSDAFQFQQMLSDTNFVRIRTKKGYSYHRNHMNSTRHETKVQRERQQIVSVYDSLRDINSDAKQFTEDEPDKSSVSSKLSCEVTSRIGVKLPRRKKNNIADKNQIQSRESDAQQNQLLYAVKRLALNQNQKNHTKDPNQQDINQQLKEDETRERLKTIHENQQDNIRVSNM